MSLKKQFQKVAQAGLLGMNVVAASVTRAAPNTDKTEAPDDVRITQQAETLPMEKSQEDLKKTLDFNNYLTGLSVYSSDRDGDLDKKAFPAISKYAVQLNTQMEKAGEPLEHRQFVVESAVDYLFRPLAGDKDISFAGYSMNPKGLRDFWANSGSSVDMSNGLNLVLTYPDSAKDSSKPSFIINVPQQEVTRLVQGMSAAYADLEQSGVIQKAGASIDGMAGKSSEEQKGYLAKMAADFNSGKLAEDMNVTSDLKEKMTNRLSAMIPKNYTISVKEPSGKVRLATEKDADLFYDMVQENVMAMDKYGAIDLTKIAGQKMVGGNEKATEDEGFFGGWGRRLKNAGKSIARASVSVAASCMTDNMIRDQIEEKVKPTLVASFNQAVARQQMDALAQNKDMIEATARMQGGMKRRTDELASDRRALEAARGQKEVAQVTSEKKPVIIQGQQGDGR